MKSDIFKLPSFAKINWFLKILGKRYDDDYHEISTLFQTISLHDTLTFSQDTEISLNCNDQNIPTNSDNLIIQAAELLQKKFDVKDGVKIYLEKNIPSPGGLGGGSSNAAIAILGLAAIWDLPASSRDLIELGKKIGADVPFFFYGGTAIGRGIGTEIEECSEITEKYLLIITPNINVITANAYSLLNFPYLTKKDDKSILTICRNPADKLNLSQINLVNDFEKSVFEYQPKIKEIKEKLLNLGAKNPLMSGSGASIFSIFDNELKQQKAYNAFKGENVKRFAVKTISRQEYKKFLEPCKHLIPKSF